MFSSTDGIPRYFEGEKMCRCNTFTQSVLLRKQQQMCIFFDRWNTKVFRGRKICRYNFFPQSVLLRKQQQMCIFFDRWNTKVFRGRKNVQMQCFPQQKNSHPIGWLLFLCWQRPIFPGGDPPSIFGTIELNYRVRNGNGWTLNVIITN